MMQRTFHTTLILLVMFFLASAHASAQEAGDLIRLASKNILATNWAMFDDRARLWLKDAGSDQVSRLSRLGAIKNVVAATDQVVGGTWSATGRAIHENGASDWLLVFSAESKKIVRVELEITFIPDQLPELPGVRFRGPGVPISSGEPSSLHPCATYSDLCSGLEHGEVDPRVVEFLFATTRQQTIVSKHITFTGERGGGAMVLGAARVRVPEDHRIGRIELPGSGLLADLISVVYETKPDPKKHFVIQDVKVLTQSDWDKLVVAKKADEALIFVHGFNNVFDESLYRMAQVVWDLQYPGVPVLFSWASRGGIKNYPYDRESAMIAKSNFIALLKMLQDQHGIKRVHVLAHSMGSLLVMDALREQFSSPSPPKIAELMFAAPDVDRNYFELNAPDVRKLVSGMTVYASAADKALAASKEFAGGIPRAGDVPLGGPVIVPQIESIDMTAVGDDILGLNHDTFAGTRSVMNDIGMLLTQDPRRLPNRRLIEIRGVPEGKTPPSYFRFSP